MILAIFVCIFSQCPQKEPGIPARRLMLVELHATSINLSQAFVPLLST